MFPDRNDSISQDGFKSGVTKGLVYAHNFRRYPRSSEHIDRLDQILRFGILSPRKAEQIGVSFSRDVNIRVTGVRNYDNIIFMFPPVTPRGVYSWEDAVTVLLTENMRVVTFEEMVKYQRGKWFNLSPSRGEVYRFGRIDQRFFRSILLPTNDPKEVDGIRGKIREYLPSLVDQIQVVSKKEYFSNHLA